MGSLNALGIRLEEGRSYLQSLREQPDIDYDVATRLRTEWPDDLVIRLMQIRREMAYDYQGDAKGRDFTLLDVLWSVDFLDHMDTVGLAVTTKGYKKEGEIWQDDDALWDHDTA